MATAGEMIGRLFFARNVAHKAHLLTTNCARHKALNDYYDAVIDLTDSFAEKFMGKYGRPDDIALVDLLRDASKSERANDGEPA